jgi:hypothetical protein
VLNVARPLVLSCNQQVGSVLDVREYSVTTAAQKSVQYSRNLHAQTVEWSYESNGVVLAPFGTRRTDSSRRKYEV